METAAVLVCSFRGTYERPQLYDLGCQYRFGMGVGIRSIDGGGKSVCVVCVDFLPGGFHQRQSNMCLCQPFR